MRMDAVFQVNPNGGAYVAPGNSAGLPTSGNALSTSINPLPGWPLTSLGTNEGSSNGSIVYHPFGMWFASDTTLYVADLAAGGATCSDLQARYANALPAALTCDVGGGGECRQSVYEALAPCLGCMIYVNDASTANDQYTAAAGSNRNDGKLPSQPLPDIDNVLRHLRTAGAIEVSNGPAVVRSPQRRECCANLLNRCDCVHCLSRSRRSG